MWLTHYKYKNLQAHMSGRIRLTTSKREVPLQNIGGTLYLKFRHEGKVVTKTAASIVYETFNGSSVGDEKVVCHLDGDSSNNAYVNLIPGDRRYARMSYARRDERILNEAGDEIEEFFARIND